MEPTVATSRAPESHATDDCLEREDGPNVRSDLGYLGTFGNGRYK
jgi:hypothetical protein